MGEIGRASGKRVVNQLVDPDDEYGAGDDANQHTQHDEYVL